MPFWSRRNRRNAPAADVATPASLVNESTVDNSLANEMVGPQQEESSWLDIFGQQEQAPALDQEQSQVEAQVVAEEQSMAPEQAAVEPKPKLDRAGGTGEKVTLTAGSKYNVAEADMSSGDPWRAIARNLGMTPATLMAFNQHVLEVQVDGGGTELQDQPLQALTVGTEIYVPSATEIAFSQCRQKAGSFEEAVGLWGKMNEGPNVKLITAARSRASEKVGESYGTAGVDGGKFYTPNPDLAGASSKRSEQVGGQTEYKVFWLDNFWKCSVFMNDVVWQAGYKPALSSNNHYNTAGSAHERKDIYTTVDGKSAMPGDCFQRFGGRGSNESHNTILSTFVSAESLGEGREQWTFNYIGAESSRAAESEQSFIVDASTQKVLEGNYEGCTLRFLRPNSKR